MFPPYKYKKAPFRGCFFAYCCKLAATAVVVATATVVSNACAATAAAEEDEDKNDYPRAVVSAEVTHCLFPPFACFHHILCMVGMMCYKILKSLDNQILI